MDGSAGAGGEQQFCLRWNNFQANITSQFEALRDDEELVDVTLAVEGQRLEAHKVVLSACSPYFKDLFKNNPCPHPIIFMRDCEAAHVRALLQFMYAGQVNIAQAQLSAFLRTADALQIRGLTDSASHADKRPHRKSPPSQLRHLLSAKPPPVARHKEGEESAEGEGAEADVGARCDTPSDLHHYSETNNISGIRVKRDLEEECEGGGDAGAAGVAAALLEPKLEVVERDEDGSDDEPPPPPYYGDDALHNPFAQLPPGAAEAGGAGAGAGEGAGAEAVKWGGGGGGGGRRARPVPDAVWLEQHRRALPFALKRDAPAPHAHLAGHAPPKLIKLGEGVEVREELLRGVKWGDYRKVTRGLAAALFSPAELATCSVTGQRWSRAGQEARPTKPPLDRRRVHALISYVSRQFPDVEVSRIKQVLAYKCKENCAALRMRAASETSALAAAAAHPAHHLPPLPALALQAHHALHDQRDLHALHDHGPPRPRLHCDSKSLAGGELAGGAAGAGVGGAGAE